MAQAVSKPARVTPAEYLAREQASETKHEYIRGHVFAMTGASPKHNWIGANLISALKQRLRAGPCGVLTSDQAVYVEKTDTNTYPDVTVLCGPAKTHRDFPHSLTNPSVLVEVLSPSTEAYDRGEKFDHFRRLESLKEYVLVSSERRAVDHFLREANGKWTLTEARGADGAIRFPSLDVTVPLAEIYDGVEQVAPEGLLPDGETPHPPSAQDA
jgi:Uma2 family endonuclease